MPSRTPSCSSRPLSRRGFLGASLGAGLAAAVALPTVAAPRAHAAAPSFRNSMSVSPFTEAVLAAGTIFTDGTRSASTAGQLQQLFNAHGATEMYVRTATLDVATDGLAEHGVQRTLQRAQLAQSLGLPLNVELGLFNVYGDVSHQPGPDFADYPNINVPSGPAWTNLTLAQMTDALYKYGRTVAKQILGTGVTVNVWDLGNEVEYGVAGVAVRSYTTSTSYWTYAAPDQVDPAIGQMDVSTLQAMSTQQQIAWLQAHLWPYIGQIFAAVAAGIRSIEPNARFSTHTSTIGLNFPGLVQAFWAAMSSAGYTPDEFGISFYPSSSPVPDGILTLQNTAASLYTTYARPLFIAEMGFPSTLMTQAPYQNWNYPVPPYTETPLGEYGCYHDLAAWGAGNGYLSGIRPWAPDFCTDEWQPMSFFTSTGVAQNAINAISDGVLQAKGASVL